MYADHIGRAARYAALALTDRDPRPDEIELLRALHDDVAANLAQTIRRLTEIKPARPVAVQVIAVARHPVGLGQPPDLPTAIGPATPATSPALAAVGWATG